MLKRDPKGTVMAIDLGSEGGSRLGDRSIQTPVSLASGDVLHVGQTRIEVFFAAREERPDELSIAPPIAKEDIGPLFSTAQPRDLQPTSEEHVLQVAMLWGDTLLDVQHFAEGVSVSVGAGEENCFQVFHPSVRRRCLLAVARDSKLSACIPAGAAWGCARGGDSQVPRATAASSEKVLAGLQDRLVVQLDSISFVLRFVRPQPGVAVRVLEQSDVGFLKVASICAVASVALIAGLLVGSKRSSSIESAGVQVPAQFARLLIRPEPKKKSLKKDTSGLPEGAKAAEEEGKVGIKDAKRDEADPSRPGTPVTDERRREQDRRRVMTAGLLGAWGKAPDASNLLGPGGLGTGLNQALGGLKPGAGLADARGVGGLGARGTGIGGGGTALGLGGLGTRGEGRGIGGSGLVDLSGKGKDTTRVVPGKTIVVGGLSKEVIAKIIRSHQSEIKYCYEVELQKNPSLFGKVAVLFIIDAAGAVSQADVSETSLGNANTEQCMLSRIRRWKFPEPEVGGLVTVTFPWIFKPAVKEES